MTPLQELEVRAADIRRRFGEIGGMAGDALTEEITAELATLRAEHAANRTAPDGVETVRRRCAHPD